MRISYDFMFDSSLEELVQKIGSEKQAWIDWKIGDAEDDPLLHVIAGNDSIVEQKKKLLWLLQQGFNPNELDSNELSILIPPTYEGNYETLQLLLQYGAKTTHHENPVELDDFPLFVLIHCYNEKGNNDRFTNLFHQYMKTGSVLFYRNEKTYRNVFHYIQEKHMSYFLTLLENYQDKMDDITFKQYKANRLTQILV